jgi:hypothetical protein
MRPLFPILFGFAALLLPSCGNTHEKMAENAISILKEIADELSTVRDASTAEAAVPQLKELGNRWRANELRMTQTRGPSVRTLKALDKKYGGQLQEAMNRYWIEVARVRRIDGGEQALAALGELKGGLKSKSP